MNDRWNIDNIIQSLSSIHSETCINSIEQLIETNLRYPIISKNDTDIKLAVENKINLIIKELKGELLSDANNIDYISIGSQLMKMLNFLNILNSKKLKIYITWINDSKNPEYKDNSEVLNIFENISSLFYLDDEIINIKNKIFKNKFQNITNNNNILKLKITENVIMIIKTKNKANKKFMKINKFLWISKIFPYLSINEYLKIRNVCSQFKGMVIISWFRLLKDQIVNDMICRNVSTIMEKESEFAKFVRIILSVYKKLLSQAIEIIDWKYIYEEVFNCEFENQGIFQNNNREGNNIKYKIDKDNPAQVNKLKLLLISIKKLLDYDLIEINNLDFADEYYFNLKKDIIMKDFVKEIYNLSYSNNYDDLLVNDRYKEFKSNFTNNSYIWLEDDTIANCHCLRILKFILRYIEQIYYLNGFIKPIIHFLNHGIKIVKEINLQGFDSNKQFFENFFEFNLLGSIISNKNKKMSWEKHLSKSMKIFTNILLEVQNKFFNINFIKTVNNNICSQLSDKNLKIKHDLIINNENNKEFKIYMDSYIKKYFIKESLNKIKYIGLINDFKHECSKTFN